MRAAGYVDRGRRRIGLAFAAGLSFVLLGLAAMQPALTARSVVGIAALLTTLSFLSLALTRYASARSRAGTRHQIGADSRGLSIDGELVLPRHAIAFAMVEDDPDGTHTVVVATRGLGGRRFLRVDSARIAQALADTLAAEPAVTEFEALPPWAHRMRALVILLTTSPWILFNVLRHLPPIALYGVLALYAVIALPMFLMQKVVIGEDGVLLRWAGRRRFVPYGSLREVRATPLGVELELHDRRPPSGTSKRHRLEVRLTHRDGTEAARAAAICERIAEAAKAHRELGPAEDAMLLSRGERDDATWLHDMTVLGRADGGYRALALPRDRLWAVLENPAADPSAREGAALALHARLDDDERERLAAIGPKSASPRLRGAIDAVARSPIGTERLRVALEELEAAPAPVEGIDDADAHATERERAS
jgi:hypothetical protein